MDQLHHVQLSQQIIFLYFDDGKKLEKKVRKKKLEKKVRKKKKKDHRITIQCHQNKNKFAYFVRHPIDF